VVLAGSYFGVPRWLSVAGAAAILVIFTVSGSFRRWERWMYVLIGVNVLMLPLILLTHPRPAQMTHDFLLPGFPAGPAGHGGLNAGVLLLVIAIVGTTVAPWQLFFQQSNVVDKRITPRWIGYERADTVIGSFVVVIGAAALIGITAFGLGGTVLHGHFTDAGAVAAGLGRAVGHHAGAMFALLLLDASLIGAAAVTLATSYALGDIAGARHSLHRGIKDAPVFYGCYAFFLAVAATVVLIPGAPLGLITEGVQALAGVLLPSAAVFLVLLCNDRDVLGPWVNPPWLNAVAGIIIGCLVLLSLVLTAATLFPSLSGGQLTALVAGGAAVGLAGTLVWAMAQWRSAHRAGLPDDPEEELGTGVVLQAERLTWRMPPLSELSRPRWSAGRRLGLLALRGYLVVAVGLVVVKIVELSLAH
jgi:Mn2+/Fe2+ NRAMP family transporter